MISTIWRQLQDRFYSFGAEYAALKASIAREGLLQTIDVLADGRIIDGHRYRACKELGTKSQTQILELTDEQALQEAERVNVVHRQVALHQIAEIRSASGLGGGPR